MIRNSPEKDLMQLLGVLQKSPNSEFVRSCIDLLTSDRVVIHFGKPISKKKLISVFNDRVKMDSDFDRRSSEFKLITLVEALEMAAEEQVIIDTIFSSLGTHKAFYSVECCKLIDINFDRTQNLTWLVDKYGKEVPELDKNYLFSFWKGKRILT